MDSDQKLFRPISSGRCEKLRESGSITYSRMRELLKKKLEELGFPSAEFSLHSLKAGGTTAAAAAAVPDKVFKKHGRWKSETAKDGLVSQEVVGHTEFGTMNVSFSQQHCRE